MQVTTHNNEVSNCTNP